MKSTKWVMSFKLVYQYCSSAVVCGRISANVVTILIQLDQSILGFYPIDFFVVANMLQCTQSIHQLLKTLFYMTFIILTKKTGNIDCINIILIFHLHIYYKSTRSLFHITNIFIYLGINSLTLGEGHEIFIVVSCQDTTGCIYARQINHSFVGRVKSSRNEPPKF